MILITGAGGFIGGNLYRFLKKTKNIVIPFSKNNIEFKKKNLEKYLKYCKILIHCVGSGVINYKKENKKKHYNNNIKTIEILISAIKNAKNRKIHIIFLSSQAVYGKNKKIPINENCPVKPSTIYGKTKYLSEVKLLKSNIKKITILRLFSIYGDGLKKQIFWDACNNIMLKNYVFSGTGEQIRDFLHIDDLKRLISVICSTDTKYKKKIFNVGTGTGLKISRLVEIIKKSLKIKFIHRFSHFKKIVNNDNYIADITLLRRYFNWRPKINYHVGISQYVNWYKKNNKHKLLI